MTEYYVHKTCNTSDNGDDNPTFVTTAFGSRDEACCYLICVLNCQIISIYDFVALFSFFFFFLRNTAAPVLTHFYRGLQRLQQTVAFAGLRELALLQVRNAS